jgi:hypothetical protein
MSPPEQTDDETFIEDSMVREYIKKMKDLCDENNIKLLLFEAPFSAFVSEIRNTNFIKNISEEIGVDFLNMIYNDIIDYSIDLSDRGHLNARGSTKVTDYVGKYILDNYGDIVKPNRNEEWDIDLLNYDNDKKQQLFKTDIYNLTNNLIYASTISDYNYEIVFKNIATQNKYIRYYSVIDSDKRRISINPTMEYFVEIKVFDNDNKYIKSIYYDFNGTLINN